MLTNQFARSGYMSAAGDDGQLVYYDDRGPKDAPAVMMSHGTTDVIFDVDHLRLWDPDEARVVTPHMRGVGRSVPYGVSKNNLFPDLAEDLEKCRTELGLGRVTHFGWSGGTMSALLHAQKYPEACNSIIIYGTYLGTEEEQNDYYARARDANPAGWRQLADFAGKDDVGDVLCSLGATMRAPDPLRRLEATIRHAMLFQIPTPDYETFKATRSPLDWETQVRRRRITFHMFDEHSGLAPGGIEAHLDKLGDMPVLILHGEKDDVVTQDAARRLAAKLPNAQLVMLPGAGHDVHDPDVQAQLRPLLADFLAQVAAKPVLPAPPGLNL